MPRPRTDPTDYGTKSPGGHKANRVRASQQGIEP